MCFTWWSFINEASYTTMRNYIIITNRTPFYKIPQTHYSNVKWVPWCLKLHAAWPFRQYIFLVSNNSSKRCVTGPFRGESISYLCIPLKRSSKAETPSWYDVGNVATAFVWRDTIRTWYNQGCISNIHLWNVWTISMIKIVVHGQCKHSHIISKWWLNVRPRSVCRKIDWVWRNNGCNV